MDPLLSRESLLGVGGLAGLMGEGSARGLEAGSSLTMVSLSLLRKLLFFVGLGDWVDLFVGDLASVLDSFGSKARGLDGSAMSAMSGRSGVPLAARDVRGLRRVDWRLAEASVMDAMLTSISVAPVWRALEMMGSSSLKMAILLPPLAYSRSMEE